MRRTAAAAFTLCFLQHLCRCEPQRLELPRLLPRRHDGSDPPSMSHRNGAWRDGAPSSEGHLQDAVTLTAPTRPLRRLRIIQRQSDDNLDNKLPMLARFGSSSGNGSVKRTGLALTPPMG